MKEQPHPEPNNHNDDRIRYIQFSDRMFKPPQGIEQPRPEQEPTCKVCKGNVWELLTHPHNHSGATGTAMPSRQNGALWQCKTCNRVIHQCDDRGNGKLPKSGMI